ncbi:hypothetical protein [Burkholderia ubonensis]|uniref:hypothetical protein n=1 Tax=Burkholderia ubonensis TaxID=101571 RepID=UPI000A4EB452|nr:hypothetical protein [Burkholderia ubonensis]
MNESVLRRYRHWVTGFAAALFIAGVIEYFLNWPRFWDLMLWDETVYMSNGIDKWSPGSFSSYESCPLYSYIYHILYSVIHSPIDLIAIVGLLGAAGAIIATAFASWVVSGNLIFGIGVGAVLVLSNFAMVVPRVIYPAVMVLTLGATLGFSRRIFAARATVLAFTSFLVAFIRPEFAVAFYLFVALSVGGWVAMLASTKNKVDLWRANRLDVVMSMVSVFFVVLLCVTWTFPVVQGGARALMAFGQHYSLYWTTVNHVSINPWLNWESILAQQLPNVTSEMQAALRYPARIMPFIGFNLRSVYQLTVDAMNNFIAKNYSFPLAIFIAVGGGIYLRMARKKAVFSMLVPRAVPLWQDAVLWLALAVPCLISVILIYAREHYLIVLAALLAIGFALVVRRLPVDNSPMISVGLAAAFVLSVNPTPAVPRPIFDIVSTLQKQGNLGKLLDSDGGWCVYLPGKCTTRFVFDIPTGESFLVFLDKDKIDSIVVSSALIGYAQANNQHAFLEMLQSPEQFHWRKIQLPSGMYLLQRE